MTKYFGSRERHHLVARSRFSIYFPPLPFPPHPCIIFFSSNKTTSEKMMNMPAGQHSKTLKSKSFGEFSYRPTVLSIAKLSQLSRLACLLRILCMLMKRSHTQKTEYRIQMKMICSILSIIVIVIMIVR